MKSISEYEQNELLKLNDDEIETIIDFMCAVEGVPLLPELPQKPAEVEHYKDQPIYRVGDFGFTTEEDAKSVADLINSLPRIKDNYDYGVGYDYRYAEGDDSVATVEATKYMSLTEYDRVKGELARYKAENKTYDTAKKEYDNVHDRRQEIAQRVWDRVNLARSELAAKQDAVRRFERYMAIAENDEDMARKFFAQAYPDDVTRLPEIVQESQS